MSLYRDIHSYIYICTYTYIYMCVCISAITTQTHNFLNNMTVHCSHHLTTKYMNMCLLQIHENNYCIQNIYYWDNTINLTQSPFSNFTRYPRNVLYNKFIDILQKSYFIYFFHHTTKIIIKLMAK